VSRFQITENEYTAILHWFLRKLLSEKVFASNIQVFQIKIIQDYCSLSSSLVDFTLLCFWFIGDKLYCTIIFLWFNCVVQFWFLYFFSLVLVFA